MGLPMGSILIGAANGFLAVMPFFVLCVMPCRSFLRFSRLKTALLAAGLVLLYIAGLFLTVPQSAPLAGWEFPLALVWLPVCAAVCAAAVRLAVSRLLYLFLMAVNYQGFAAALARFVQARIWPEIARPLLSAEYLFLQAVVLGLTFPLVFLFAERRCAPFLSMREGAKSLGSLWLIPAAFSLFNLYQMVLCGGPFAWASPLGTPFFFCMVQAAAFVVYEGIARILGEEAAGLRRSRKEHQRMMERVQYETLRTRMESSSRAVQSQRNHIMALESCVDQDDRIGLQGQLRRYRVSVLPAAQDDFCEQQAVNTVLAYYSALAKTRGIAFVTRLALPGPLAVSDADITVLLGSLLENALEGCCRQTEGERYIELTMSGNDTGGLGIVIQNSYGGTVRRMGDTFLSTKRADAGLGIPAVREIVSRCFGTIRFDYRDDVFKVSVSIADASSPIRE